MLGTDSGNALANIACHITNYTEVIITICLVFIRL